jgi:hypothetical protein
MARVAVPARIASRAAAFPSQSRDKGAFDLSDQDLVKMLAVALARLLRLP